MPKVSRHGDKGIKGGIAVPAKPLRDITDHPATAVVGDIYLCRKHSASPQKLKNGCLFYKPHGQPAAMQYATKATCGCRIIEGSDVHACCPHLDAKARRLAEREMLIEQARDAAGAGTAAGVSPAEAAILRARAGDLERLNRDVRFAEMSVAVYQSPDLPPTLTQGYGNAPEASIRLTDGEFRELMPEPLNNPDLPWDDKKSGFHADLYYDELHGTYVISYRGTEAAMNDAITDHNQAHGLETVQYNQAMKIGDAAMVTKQDPRYEGIDLQTTGHSLGGGEASGAGTVGGIPYTTFNAAGLHPNTVSRYTEGKLTNANGAGLGVNYSTDHDPLTWSQTPEGSAKIYTTVPAAGRLFQQVSRILPGGLPLAILGAEIETYAGWSQGRTGGQLPPSPAGSRYALPATVGEGQAGLYREIDGMQGWGKGHSSLVILDSIEAAKVSHQAALRRLLDRAAQRKGST